MGCWMDVGWMLDVEAACFQTAPGLVCPVHILTTDLLLELRRVGG